MKNKPKARIQNDPPITLCELRPGIGLCDECGQPKWPQEYMGYGIMLCLDCLAEAKKQVIHKLKR